MQVPPSMALTATADDDALAITEAIERLGAKVTSDHFFCLKARKLASMAGLSNSGPERLRGALVDLVDRSDHQVVISEKNGHPEHIYLRLDQKIAPNTCAPMHATDVQAICAMVGGGGVAELEAIPAAQLSDMRRHGCPRNPGMRERLLGVLAKYSTARSCLTDDPLSIDAFVAKSAKDQAARKAAWKAARLTTSAPAKETDVTQPIAERPMTVPSDSDFPDPCPRCDDMPLDNGYAVCENCSAELYQQEQDEPERAVALDRRSGSSVLVSGMIFDPERIRRLLGRGVRVTREIQNTMLPPLTDELEDDEEPLGARDRGKLLHQMDARVSDLRSILSSMRAEFVEDDDASRIAASLRS